MVLLALKEDYALKNVRIWFTKDGAARYISHLDLNRCMIRAIQKSKIPVWHTEGFNKRIFLTFSLPLSLGFRGEKESMDIKLLEETEDDKIISELNASLPEGIRVFAVTEPKMKPKEISFAEFSINFFTKEDNTKELFLNLHNLLTKDKILVEKKSKSGIKQVDIKEMIIKYKLDKLENSVKLDCTLMAGSVQNMNPSLIEKAYEIEYNKKIYTDITRKNLYNKDMEVFS